MNWVVFALIAGVAGWLVTRRKPTSPNGGQRDSRLFDVEITSRVIHVDDAAPDNPRFVTWEQAMNRPIKDRISYRIEYADVDGVVTERDIIPKSIHLTAHQPDVAILADCLLRGDERTFRSERILGAVNSQNGRRIRDLGAYLRRKY